ncbi:MAG: DsbA family oxidoreductase [Alphaproteobacteria bacterium]|nr:MAG: DsbA family oxidoreductase [Alphaproteobacteria bacterium]
MILDIFSDTICPWCFIGKRRLERALRERPQPGLHIRWRAFQLNPDMPPEGMDRQRYLELKFGGAANAKAVYDQVRAAGESEGIPFAFERIARTPNTVDSHRLIRFAERLGRQDDVVEALFTAYFLNGKDIGDRDVLTTVAASAGLNADEVHAFLASDAEVEGVRAEDATARRAGINGVPCFVFNGAYALAGAHPPEVLFQLFDLAHQGGDSAEAVSPPSGQAAS